MVHFLKICLVYLLLLRCSFSKHKVNIQSTSEINTNRKRYVLYTKVVLDNRTRASLYTFSSLNEVKVTTGFRHSGYKMDVYVLKENIFFDDLVLSDVLQVLQFHNLKQFN